MATETSSTIGEQRRTNYALKPMTKEQFVELMTSDLPDAPSYFSRDAEINRSGAPALSELTPLEKLSAPTVNKLSQQGVLVLDVRSSQEFGSGHVPGSMHIGLTGQFAPWSGSLLKPEQAVALIADDLEHVKEAAMRLARVGLHKVVGYLEGGILSWVQAGLPLDSLAQLSVEEVSEELSGHNAMEVIDVRRPQEFATGHVPQARNIPLAELEKHIQELPADRPVAVICASGYRSSIASSILKIHGFQSPINVVGGTKAWERSGLPMAS
jgi:rhodanese-related sulfurtransferase